MRGSYAVLLHQLPERAAVFACDTGGSGDVACRGQEYVFNIHLLKCADGSRFRLVKRFMLG